MKKLGISALKVLVVVGFVIGLLSFTRSLSPQRNEIQKVFDDFVKQISTTSTSSDPLDKEFSTPPTVSIELAIRENGEIKVLKHVVNWSDRNDLQKSLRVLDLLQLANIFTQSDPRNADNADISFKIVSPSGYKFESYLRSSALENNSPLGLAVVLMRELQA